MAAFQRLATEAPVELKPCFDEVLRHAQEPHELAVIYEFAMELLRTHLVKEASLEAAKQALGERGVVDLTAFVGTYYAIGGLLNVAEVSAPAGDGPEILPVAQPSLSNCG